MALNTNPFLKPVQYYGSIDIDGCFQLGVLWRYRYEADLIFQEQWNTTSKCWESTSYLLKMIIDGECSLADLTEDQAKKVEPRAFEID